MKHSLARITRQPLAILILLLATVALLACGPATEPTAGGTGPVTQAESTPQPTEEHTQAPPAVHPTDTPKPPPPEPPTPKPTKPPRPTPTREPGDVAPPTYTPEPTPVPSTPDPPPTYPEHPDGLEGCKTLSEFTATREEVRYVFWCSDAIQDYIREQCRGTGTTWEEKQCAYRELEQVKNYSFRYITGPCAAISDDSDRRGCFNEAIETARAHYDNLTLVWNDIVAAVDADPEVKVRYRAMVECVRDAEHKPPDPSYPLSWQQIDPAKMPDKPYPQSTERGRVRGLLKGQKGAPLNLG